MGWQGRQKHHGRASAWSLVWGAGRGWAEELSYPGLLLPQTQLKHKLIIIHSQINGATRALEDVRARQEAMWDAAHKKMEQLRQDYIEMKALIDASEASSTQKIKEEEKRVSSKFDNIYQILLKKKNEIEILKEEIELALTEGDEFEFLEVGLDEDIIGHSAWHDSVVYRCPGALKELGCKRSLEASPTHAQYPFSMLCDNQPQT